MKQYLEAGEFVTTHGVMGELKLYPWCDDAQFVAQLPRLYMGKHGEREVKIEGARVHKGMCLLRLQGVHSIDEARPYLRKVAYFNRDDAPLPDGRYFVQDILDCEVRDADTGEVYGRVTDVTHPAAIDIYTIKTPKGEQVLFPAVPEFLVQLCPLQGYVTVRPIPGMFTPADAVEEGADDAH
jgi:16S rRNA processing protein RimM